MTHTRKLIKEELLRVASDCFSQRGYQDTTLDEIVCKVGISRVTFYTYFESKAALLAAIFERTLTAYRRGLENILAQPLSRVEKIRLTMNHHITSLTGQHPLIRLLFREETNLPDDAIEVVLKMHRDIDRLIEKEIKIGIRKGELIDEDPRLLMYAFTGMCNWLYRWYRPGESITPDDIVRVFCRILESGCLTPEAQAADNKAVAERLQRIENHLQQVKQELKQVTQQLHAHSRRRRAS